MEKKLLAIRSRQLPKDGTKPENAKMTAVVQYEKIDDAHYSFFCTFNREAAFRMDETDRPEQRSRFEKAEFEETVPELERAYYTLAAASGLLTGSLGRLYLSKEKLQKIQDWNEKSWKPIILETAKLIGYKGKNYNAAVNYLINRTIRTIEKNEKAKELLIVLAEHPSLAGFVFSIITQYCGSTVILSKTGEVSFEKLPDYYIVGNTDGEKLIAAFFYWLFAMAANEAESPRRVIDELGISEEFCQKIKEFAKISFIKDIPTDYEQAEKLFSKWLAKILGSAASNVEQERDEKKRLHFAAMGEMFDLERDVLLVLLNESIVRGLYILIRLCDTIRERHIASFDELCEVLPSDIVKFDERLLSKMCFIASAVFMAVNIGRAVLKGIYGKVVKGRRFAECFLAELNIPGVARFVFAIAAEFKYLGKDIHILFQNKQSRKTAGEGHGDQQTDGKACMPFFLDAGQARLLYSLEERAVQYDIDHTDKKEEIENKKKWLDSWKKMIVYGIDISPEFAEQYFVDNEDYLFEGMYNVIKEQNSRRWFYLLSQELALFEPYTTLGLAEDKEFKRLKKVKQPDFLEDQFVRRQTVVSQREVDEIKTQYQRYRAYVSGNARKKVFGIGAMAVAAIATGGIALNFAPGIATAIAGEAVAGLHGAALTSASLAFVGGGSLAAGGLGMAGGTAIITGGGALIGLAGSGSVSAAAIMLSTPTEYWVRQSAKLLTFCNCVLLGVMNDQASLRAVSENVKDVITDTERDLRAIKDEKNDLDKDYISKLEEYLKYIKRSDKELEKLLTRGKQ